MALIIEDGSIVADADTFASVADLDAFTSKRGIALAAADEAAKEILLIKAMDFLETLEPRFQGSRINAEQTLSWPRQDVSINGFEWAEDSIPGQLIKAQLQLAVYAETVDLLPAGDGREVIKEKVGPLETTYADTGSANPQPALTAFWEFISPLLVGGGAFTLDLEHA